MTTMIEATPEFVQTTGTVRFIVNALTADNVFLEGDDGIAYRADLEIQVNPARVLTEPRALADRLRALEGSWTEDEIRQAVVQARTALRSNFRVLQNADEALIELQGRRLRIRRDTWRDAVEDLAIMRGTTPRAVRAELLDQARLALANSIAAFEWD